MRATADGAIANDRPKTRPNTCTLERHHDDRQQRQDRHESERIGGLPSCLRLFHRQERRNGRHRNGDQRDLHRPAEVEHPGEYDRDDGHDHEDRDHRAQEQAGTATQVEQIS